MALTASSSAGHLHGSGLSTLPVLVAINALGVHIRPLPPRHTPSSSYHYAAAPALTPLPQAPSPALGLERLEADARASSRLRCLGPHPSPSELLSADGRPVPWHLHPVGTVVVWGTKKVLLLRGAGR